VAIATTWETLKRVPWSRRPHKLDVLGSTLVIAATASLMLALALGPQASFGWTAPWVLALFALTAVLTPILSWHLLRTSEPLVPIEVLGNKIVLTATFSVFFSMASFIGLSVVVPLYLQLILHMNASQAGFGLLGYTVGTVVGAMYAGRAMVNAENYKLLPTAGLLVAAVGLAWLAFRADVIGVVEAELVLIVIGLGSGPQFPTTTVAVQNAVEPHNVGVATGMISFLRALGSAVGVAVIGAVTAASGIKVGEGFNVDASKLTALTGAAFKPVFLAMSLSVALGLIWLAMMPSKPLRATNAPTQRPDMR
jgi:MFS family permease